MHMGGGALVLIAAALSAAAKTEEKPLLAVLEFTNRLGAADPFVEPLEPEA